VGIEAHKRHRSPEAITTDGLRSCGAVIDELTNFAAGINWRTASANNQRRCANLL
jgi:hypothetical protein